MARFLKDKQKSKGAAPGSLIFIGRQKINYSCIKMMQYNADYVKEGKITSLDNISEYISNDHVTWISLQGLHDAQLVGQLGKKFDISPLILEDILNTDERPKFLEDDNHIYIILKSISFNQESRKVQIDQISMVLGPNYLITIQETDCDYFEDVIKRICAGQTKIRSLPPDYLCYTFIDTIVDGYILNIEKIGSVIEEQESILLNTHKQIIEDIYRYKTELSYIRKSIRPTKELMSRFLSSDSTLINERTFNYLRDLEGLVTQALEALEIYYTMIADQQNSYNTNLDKNANEVMKVLTIFSTIFIPLTFLVGVYGMNFEYIPALKYHYAYHVLWGVMVIITIIMLLFFKRKKWL